MSAVCPHFLWRDVQVMEFIFVFPQETSKKGESAIMFCAGEIHINQCDSLTNNTVCSFEATCKGK